MLTLIAYDITDRKRLHKVARLCEDYGMRVQYSVFECRLEAAAFERFWAELHSLLDPASDIAVAYPICARCAREIRDAGNMVHNETVVAYFC
jgi:CRISPR-associated protein Cas2